jgi:hypothetical protein
MLMVLFCCRDRDRVFAAGEEARGFAALRCQVGLGEDGGELILR